MKEKPECHLCEQKILYLEPGMRHTECRLGYSLTEGKCVKTKDLKTNDMEKTIEIPEGYEARIEGNKVILERKESEDEKVRKTLIHIVKGACDRYGIKYSGDKITEEKLLAYLEKQKVQKPVQDKEEREYVRTLKSLIADFLRDKEDVNRGYYQDIYDWLDGRHIEQKPAEDKDAIESTPKQDYSGLTDLERAIHRGFLCAGVENVPVDIIRDTAQDCLAHIKPAEWSEKDKIHLNNAILVAKKEWGVNSYTARFLEDLRDNYKKCNSRWKPSDEQMEILWDALAFLKYNYYENAKELESLYSDLEKL